MRIGVLPATAHCKVGPSVAQPHNGAWPATPCPLLAEHTHCCQYRPAVTIEYQRQRAKEMRAFFQERKAQEQMGKTQ